MFIKLIACMQIVRWLLMNYNTLANYYDDLVKDDEATQAWVTWIQKFQKPCIMLELACGSGEITHELHRLSYQMSALDLSEAMIEKARKKDDKITYYCQDMRNLSNLGSYDAIACLCDSFNYLLSKEDVLNFFKEVSQHLNQDGLFFFDTHSLDRLSEFSQEWNETGTFFDGLHYQWSISSEDDWIYQDFAFYLANGKVEQEHHLQRVYTPQWLEEAFAPYFKMIDCCTDFELAGIQEGEKYFYVLKKEG